MALFTEAALRTQADRELRTAGVTVESLLRAQTRTFNPQQAYDIFLSHAFKDAPLIYALWKQLTSLGVRVYVDWIEDPADRANVTPTVAAQLRERMASCASFLYAVTDGAKDSAWMPWELGYFDALKQRVAVLPIVRNTSPSDVYKGREYLGLYPYITLAAMESTGQPAIWVHAAENPDAYVLFNAWLKRAEPFVRV